MATREPGSADAVLSFLQAMPPERRNEPRAHVRAGRDARRRDETQDASAAQGTASARGTGEAAAGTRLPAMSAEQTTALADQIMLAALRQEGRRVKALIAAASPEPDIDFTGHIVRMNKVSPVSLHWRSPGRIAAGKITVLDGDPGLGKSTLLCELAARITRGDALPGGEREEPRTVLLLSAEDDLHDTIRPRLDAAGGDAARVLSLLTMPDGTKEGRPFAIPGDAWLLEEMALRFEIALIIIDPLVAYLQGGLNANSDQDVRRALASLKVVGEKTGAAIVAMRHLNKSAGANPLYRGGGSIGIIGAARCGLLLAADPEEPERRILAATKGNLGKPPPSLAFRLVEDADTGVARVHWEGETRWTAGQLLRAADEDGDEERSALGEARAWLRAALANGPRPATEMQAAAEERGFSKGTIKRARSAEGVIARKDKGNHGGWTWALRDENGKESHAPEPENLATLATLATLPLPNPTSGPSLESEDGISEPDPWDRRCLDCDEVLPRDRSNRCEPCLARALTD